MPRLPVDGIDVLVIDRMDDVRGSEGFVDTGGLQPLQFEMGALI